MPDFEKILRVSLLFKPKALTEVTAATRVVHDLGISGDDWDSFYGELSRAYGWDFEIDAKYMPAEVTYDSFNVSSANGFLAAWFPRLRLHYISKIRCPPLTLAELHEVIMSFKPKAGGDQECS